MSEPKENYETFMKRLAHLPEDEQDDIDHAYVIAKFAHRHQTRKQLDADGRPIRYFEHTRWAAIVLMDIVGCFDVVMVQSMILHDTIEDTRAVNFRKLKRWFGREVANLVLSVSKVPENLEPVESSNDWRKLLLKACDRYHNLTTLSAGTPEFQRKQILETREKYLPLFVNLLSICPMKYYEGAKRLSFAIEEIVTEYFQK